MAKYFKGIGIKKILEVEWQKIKWKDGAEKLFWGYHAKIF